MRETSEVEVRAAFDRATASVAPSPDLLIRVQRGGRRRLRRAAAALASVVALLLVAGIAASGFPTLDWVPPASSRDRKPLLPVLESRMGLLGRPTTGDLAENQAYRQSVLDAWKLSWDSARFHENNLRATLVGRPHFVWAGTTPGGPAAVVAQDAYARDPASPSRGSSRYVIVGYFGDLGNGVPEFLGDDYARTGSLPLAAFLTGPTLSTLVVPDTGQRIERCHSLIYHDNAQVECNWRPLRKLNDAWTTQFAANDSSFELQADRRKLVGMVNLLEMRPDLAPPATDNRCLGWEADETDTAFIPINRVADWDRDQDRVQSTFSRALYAQPNYDGKYRRNRCGEWFAYGSLPSGMRFIVSTAAVERDPSQLFVVLVNGKRTRGLRLGEIDSRAPLPVIAPLPDNAGIVVVKKNVELRWRTDDGPWSETATSAALIPVNATEVEVTPESGASTIVPLPR